jgi:hypothetical protein
MTRRMMSFKPLTVVFFATVCRRRNVRKEERRGDSVWYAPQCVSYGESTVWYAPQCVSYGESTVWYAPQCYGVRSLLGESQRDGEELHNAVYIRLQLYESR